MFEALATPQDTTKDDFKQEEPALRTQMIDMQMELRDAARFPVIVLLSGLDLVGRSNTARRLQSWMDPRLIRPYAEVRPLETQWKHPRMWRFWQALPKNGSLGLFLTSWYEGPIGDMRVGRIGRPRYERYVEEIKHFEQMLAFEGALFVKFFFVLPKNEHLAAIKRLQKDPSVAWKLSLEEAEISRQFAKRYDESVAIVEEMVSATSTAFAPWIAIPSSNPYDRDLRVGKSILNCVKERLRETSPSVSLSNPFASVLGQGTNILDTLDLSQTLERETYRQELKREQKKLTKLTLDEKFENRALLVVFEGNDAAGKGGSIRRVVQALDPRLSRVIPIAAPTDEEKAHHYLWRFWRHIPEKSHVTIFDRSWYGRVLVERVEGFCNEEEWMFAYQEIRNFEEELDDYGIIVVKFWLAIDKDEQLSRFEAREQTGYKRYKITDEDWRNREKWDDYRKAVHDMVAATGTRRNPWTLVEANDKYFARVKILKTLNDRLSAAFES